MDPSAARPSSGATGADPVACPGCGAPAPGPFCSQCGEELATHREASTGGALAAGATAAIVQRPRSCARSSRLSRIPDCSPANTSAGVAGATCGPCIYLYLAVRRIAGEARWIAAVKAVLLTVVAIVVLQVYRLICSCSRSIPCEAAWARQRRRACARRPCPPGIFLADSAISSPKRPWRPCTWHPSLRSRFADARRRMQRRRESRAMAP